MDSPAEKARLFCFVPEIDFGNKIAKIANWYNLGQNMRIIFVSFCVT